MAMLRSSIAITYVDFDLEPTTIVVHGAPVLEDGTNYVTVQAYWDAVEAAIDGVVVGTKVKVQRVAREEIFERARPAAAAQRETKLFIAGHNFSSFQARERSIGTFDTSLLVTPPAGQNLPSYIDLTAGAGLALKDALDDYWTDAPDYLVQVVTDSAVHVGRNT